MRTLRTVLGLIAFVMLIVAFGDVALHNRFTLMPPWQFTVLVVSVLGFLLHEFIVARQRVEVLDRQAAQLKSAGHRLEQSLQAAAAFNARLNQSEARYKALVDAQGDAIFRRAPDSRLTYGNDAFFKLFGLNSQRAVGQPFATELHPSSRAPIFGSFAGLESGRNRVRYDQHVRTAYGWRWMAWEDYAVRDAHGRLVEVQSVGRDITERKALEDAITEARDKAEAGSRAKSGFLATMSHEIRTPMNGVLGMARLLQETELRPEQRTYVEAIRKSGEALLSLIGDILDFSKIEAGSFTPEDDEVELRPLVEAVVELCCPRAHDKAIEIIAAVDAGVPSVIRSDSLRLRQVLTNLVGNAVKFTEKGGVLVHAYIAQANHRHYVRFDVRDTGVGVPTEKRGEIFNEFVQADSSHARKFGGTGLGLAISKKLVEGMGGEIGITEAPGGGSQFWFTIPAVVVRAAPEDTRLLEGRTIAIVTRNPILREGLSAQVGAAGGAVRDIRDAFGPKPDLVIVDAGTDPHPAPPGDPVRGVPSLVLLTPAARSQLGVLREMGFAGYLMKPVRQSSLVERIRMSRCHVPARPEPETDTTPPIPNMWAPIAAFVQAAEPEAAFSGSLNILLAEDNPINALLTRELLRRRGHKVTEVTDGGAAVKAMENGGFDIVLTDIHMPGMDGIEATRAIRAFEAANGRRRTPIVALTADALETGKRGCKEAGMDGFLTKPIEPAQLDRMFNILFPSAAALNNAAA
ncbi:MAG: response regulator [Alphaproteobacteria bacterium]|nr:response regulator [Alphaproteobacteria bacterium]MBL6938960.1 response regulator [Alphaproteobacteria bacterium]MBL7099552.1 response regulator [Alphaproteobacteria bacterium]